MYTPITHCALFYLPVLQRSYHHWYLLSIFCQDYTGGAAKTQPSHRSACNLVKQSVFCSHGRGSLRPGRHSTIPCTSSTFSLICGSCRGKHWTGIHDVATARLISSSYFQSPWCFIIKEKCTHPRLCYRSAKVFVSQPKFLTSQKFIKPSDGGPEADDQHAWRVNRGER